MSTEGWRGALGGPPVSVDRQTRDRALGQGDGWERGPASLGCDLVRLVRLVSIQSVWSI